jgi:hypothetical protein
MVDRLLNRGSSLESGARGDELGYQAALTHLGQDDGVTGLGEGEPGGLGAVRGQEWEEGQGAVVEWGARLEPGQHLVDRGDLVGRVGHVSGDAARHVPVLVGTDFQKRSRRRYHLDAWGSPMTSRRRRCIWHRRIRST